MLLVNIVGRNEADRYLRQILAAAEQYADVLIFTDDKSDDHTPDLALSFGASVMQTEEPLFEKDEHLLRSLAWQHLSEFAHPGDWVLCLDCDEVLFGADNLATLMDQNIHDVLGITFYHMWSPLQYRVDKAWRPSLAHRLFRYYEGGEFKRQQLACGAEPTYVEELIRRGRVNWTTGLRMMHLGYLRDEDKAMKFDRYMALDGGRYHSLPHLESILDTNPELVDWEY